jgi:cytochrome c553
MHRLAAIALAAALLASAATTARADRRIDFNRDIRPILTDNCYFCHGPDKEQRKAELRLDTKEGLFRIKDDVAAVVPGKPDDSVMFMRITSDDPEFVMPHPDSKKTLKPEQIQLIKQWIEQGAEWKGHWSFETPPRPPVPEADFEKFARNPIDHFIAEKLIEQKLKPSREADRATLIRRVTYDLTGLPPTPTEIDAFVDDPRPDSYEKLVDRLLASPRYGERWGRHWLDVVHFGESHGYDKDKPRPNAWPYRDYVIRAFNQDKPYSRFVREQLAGDVLYPGTTDGIVATGFIAAGPWDFVGHVELREGTVDKQITRSNDRDDMVMTTMSTFQSLTVHCARCHDHKFDPILQEDYYRLQACFAGIDRGERNYDADPQTIVLKNKLTAERADLETKLLALNAAAVKVTSPEIAQVDARLAELRPQVVTLPPITGAGPSSLGYHSEIVSSPNTTKWVQVDLGKLVPIDQIFLTPAHVVYGGYAGPGFGFPIRFRVDVSDDPAFATYETVADHTSDDVPNPGDVPFGILTSGKSARYVRVTATKLFERTHDWIFALAELVVFSGGTNIATGATVASFDSIEAPPLWSRPNLVDGQSIYSAVGPEGSSSRDWIGALATNKFGRELRALEQRRRNLVIAQLDEPARKALTETPQRVAAIDSQIAALPKPRQVYSVVPLAKPRPINLLTRGDVKQPKQIMAAGPPKVFAGTQPSFAIDNADDEGARRAALAEWITAKKNLLTRRSIVNRIWHHHFGRGIVDSPNDFGHMGAMPTHPELLDWLAYSFLDSGESLKALHRLIVTSSTYRQSSAPDDAAEKIDADNRYMWRMNRTRLDAEEVHDAMLKITGKLDLKMGGPSVQQFVFKDGESPTYDYQRFDVDDPASFRRSIYRFIVRSVPDPLMDTLDCPDPSVLSPKRNTTLTALQALSLLNNPFIIRQSEHFAEKLAKETPDPAAQIAMAYRLALGRAPTPEELHLMTAHAARFGLANVCRVIFNSNEFVFVD